MNKFQNKFQSKVHIIITAAVLYALSIPVSKIILDNGVNPDMLAAFTYLGAGFGLGFCALVNKFVLKRHFSNPLTKKELPFLAAMVILDIAAILLLMNGIAHTNSANASLLSNIEIAAASIAALVFFKEHISRRLWTAVFLIIAAGIILTYEGTESFSFSAGSLLAAAAYICWGAEDNCTKRLSIKNTQQITMIKGLFSGAGSLVIAFLSGAPLPGAFWLFVILLTGFLSYGLSVLLYIQSQRYLGVSKTAAYFSSAPFFGVFFSLIILGETPELKFYAAFALMAAAAFLLKKEC